MSEKQSKIHLMEKKLASYEQDLLARPQSVLRISSIDIEPPECLKRLSGWHKSESSKVAGSGFSQHITSYDGHFISQFGRFTVRAVCPSQGDKAVISVTYSNRSDDQIAMHSAVEMIDGILDLIRQ